MATNEPKRVVVGKVGEWKRGEMREAEVGEGNKVLVVRTSSGEVHAMGTKCRCGHELAVLMRRAPPPPPPLGRLPARRARCSPAARLVGGLGADEWVALLPRPRRAKAARHRDRLGTGRCAHG